MARIVQEEPIPLHDTFWQDLIDHLRRAWYQGSSVVAHVKRDWEDWPGVPWVITEDVLRRRGKPQRGTDIDWSGRLNWKTTSSVGERPDQHGCASKKTMELIAEFIVILQVFAFGFKIQIFLGPLSAP